MSKTYQPGIYDGVPAVARYVVFNLADKGADAQAIKDALTRLSPLANGSDVVLGVVVTRLTPRQVRHVMSYAAQQTSGIPFWNRDPHHVEKAFDFGGMPARNGVSAALMVAAGFSAVDDPLAGTSLGTDTGPMGPGFPLRQT